MLKYSSCSILSGVVRMLTSVRNGIRTRRFLRTQASTALAIRVEPISNFFELFPRRFFSIFFSFEKSRRRFRADEENFWQPAEKKLSLSQIFGMIMKKKKKKKRLIIIFQNLNQQQKFPPTLFLSS